MAHPTTIVSIDESGISNRATVARFFKELKIGRHELTAKHLNKRSLPQNKFYWGYVIAEAQRGFKELGHDLTKEEVHEFFKARFNYSEIINHDTGECLQIPRSTTGLSKSDFSEYIEKIQQFCAEWLNVVILDAGQQTMINYE